MEYKNLFCVGNHYDVSIHSLDTQVNQYLSNGWKLYGNVVLTLYGDRGYVVQTVVRDKPNEDSNEKP